MASTRARVPAHLRRFVVEQDYDAYTAVDHAVWRFALLQMYDRLRADAHPAYARGLFQTGMSVERIPRIAEMDACLGAFGWGAVCVDGFIPPRAFQEFQARGILPIAADMRSAEHLPYTPAPDIIHEAAGHAPILPDPEYAEFLRRIGDYGMQAFASQYDARMYDAIYRLSVVKEQRDATPAEIADAEATLAALALREVEPSEAAKLSRLYWWTVEYGLVGSPVDYRLYGAGLLSSLGESHFCHAPEVRKLPLTAGCVEVDYDITRPQPQLFVARDFAQLGRVLEEVCAGFAFRTGGVAGLRTAQAAGEVATLELDSGLQVTGVVDEVHAQGERARRIALRGACALAERGRMLAGHDRSAYPSGLVLELADSGARPFTVAAASSHAASTARPVVRVAGERVLAVRAGASDPAYWPEQEFPSTKAPARRPERPAQRALRELYERIARARASGADAALELERIDDVLQRDYPEQWLPRWNVLQYLSELQLSPERRARLAAELWRLERHYAGEHPIAMGLRYLGYAEPSTSACSSAMP